MEARVARLEEAFGRVELLLTRLDERVAGLATKAELTEATSRLDERTAALATRVELMEATGRLETELARKPGTASVWGIGVALVVGGYALILATLGVVVGALGLHH